MSHPEEAIWVMIECFKSCYNLNQSKTRAPIGNFVEESIELLAKEHPNQTILVISYGGLRTKLYEYLSGDIN